MLTHSVSSVKPAIALFLAGWILSPFVWASDRPDITVAIPPMAAIARAVAGPDANVRVLLPPTASPETYHPGARDLNRLAGADVLFTVGTPFEKALVPRLQSALPDLRVVDTAAGIEKRHFQPSPWEDDDHGHDHDHDDHDHHHHHDHSHGAGAEDPHVWLNPLNAAKMADAMAAALADLHPADSDYYRENARAFGERMAALDAELAETLAPVRGRILFVYHPAFGYFSDHYGLRQVAIESLGQRPTPRQLAQLLRMASAEGIRAVFAQTQFDQKSARMLAENLDAHVYLLDPLAENYMDNLRTMAQTIRKGLQAPSPAHP